MDNVHFRYGTATLFTALSLHIERNRHTVLLGRNGAGKSSLLRLLQGELRPSTSPAGSGTIYWNFTGTEETSALAAREHVRLVSSELQRNYIRRGWNITGEEIILSGLENTPMVYGEISSGHYAAAVDLAESAAASGLLALHAPAMSQGQLRLVLILRALISKPALLLLDEPFDGLDHAAREAVNHCLELAVARGTTLLVTAHRRRDIPALVTRALLLENNVIREVDPHSREAALSSDGKSAVIAVDGVIGAATLAEAGTGIADALSQSEGTFSQVADSLHNPFLRALAERARPLFCLRNVDVFIERQKVLSDIHWTVNPGESWIVSGSNGSGKSTLLRLLYGEEFAAWGGTLEWCGGLRPSLEDLHLGVGFVSDRLQHSYDYDLSAEDVVISGIHGTIGLYREPGMSERALARCWLERMGIGDYAARALHSLSGGTARKALLARALASSPPVLLLDEPCTGLDTRSRHLFLDALSLLANDGVTIIYVSHHDEDKCTFFKKELCLEKGRIASLSG